MKSNERVIVVGGGIIGCLTALYLHRLGARPVVLERGTVGQESSWAGAGILCPIHPWLYPDSFTHLINYSLALYPDLHRELVATTGIDSQWRNNGLMIPFFADDRVHHRDAALRWSARFQWPVEQLDRQQCCTQEPTISPDVEGALRWPEVGQVRNPRLLTAVRKAMALEGVPIREQSPVAGLQFGGRGEVRGVVLAGGEVIEAEMVLLAAGSWSGELGAASGLSLPIEPVKGQIVLIKDEPERVRHIIKHDNAYLVPRVDGHILVGASMERVGFQRGTTRETIDALLAATWRMHPALKQARIVREWMGFRPGTPDGMPYLGPVREHAGLWVSSGHYRNGVALAPGSAELISRWMMGVQPEVDLHDFRVDRPLQPRAAIGLPEKTNAT